MRFKFLAASAAFFFATSAYAQNTGTVTSNAFAIGRGAGKTGFASVLCAQAQIAIGQTAANPICAALSGDITMTAAGVTAIGANKVTNSQLSTAAAFTFKGNNTSGTAAPTDVSIAGLTTKASPGAGDFVILSDQAASGAWKKATVSSLSSGVVSSIAGNTGAFTLSGGITNSTNDIRLVSRSVFQSTNGGIASPSATASTSAVMAGMAASGQSSPCVITPAFSTRVRFTISGAQRINTAAASITIGLRFGTGTAPTANAASTGTAVGTPIATDVPSASAGGFTSFSQTGIITGLTAGVAVWLDAAYNTSNAANTAQLGTLSCSATEE